MRKGQILIALLLTALLLIPAQVSLADIIILQDGRSVEGEIIKRSKRTLTVKTAKGIITTIERSEIERIVTKEDLIKEYETKRKELKLAKKQDDLDAHMVLAEWCKKNGLKAEQMDELNEVLRIDPENKEAQKMIHLLEGTVPDEWKEEKKRSPRTRLAKKNAKRSNGNKNSSGGKVIVVGKGGGGKFKGGKGSPAKPDKTNKVLAKALAFLAKGQSKGGTWPCKMSHYNGQVLVTSYCALAMMAAGSTPAKGPYCANVNRAKNFVMKVITLESRFGKAKRGGKNMNQSLWRWGAGGMFLAECYAVHKDPAIKAKLQEVVKKIEDAQEPSGGWGHGPGGPNMLNYVELEVVSNYALATLGMAKKLGCKVDSAKLKKACDYVVQCTNGMGGVGYSTRRGQRGFGCPGRSGGAILGFTLCKYNHPMYTKMIKYLDKTIGDIPMGHASPAIHFIGGGLGSLQVSKGLWNKYVQTLFPVILEHANDDGSFRAVVNPKEGDHDTNNGIYYSSGIYTFLLAVDQGRLRFLSGKYGGRKVSSDEPKKKDKKVEKKEKEGPQAPS
jgi:hypothetical protein